GTVAIAEKLVVLPQYPSDVPLTVSGRVARVGDFDGRMRYGLGRTGHRHVVGEKQVPIAVKDGHGNLERGLLELLLDLVLLLLGEQSFPIGLSQLPECEP